MKRTLFASTFCLAVSTVVGATTTPMTLNNVDPTPWRLQTYTSATADTVAVYYTTSACGPSQHLLFPSSVPSEKNRFWNTILAAKLAKKKMFFSYDYDSTAETCYVTSYAIQEE